MFAFTFNPSQICSKYVYMYMYMYMALHACTLLLTLHVFRAKQFEIPTQFVARLIYIGNLQYLTNSSIHYLEDRFVLKCIAQGFL